MLLLESSQLLLRQWRWHARMTIARCISRNLIPLWLLILLLTSTPERVLAQDAAGIQAEQSASFVYGESLTFEVRATAPGTLQSARLTVRVANRESIFSEAVSIQPGTTISAFHTMTVEALRLPPVARISYFWDFQDANSNLYRSDEQMLLYEDTYVSWRWERVSQGRITVNTDGRDQIASSTAVEIATGALAKQSQSLGFTIQDDILIYVYPDLAQMASSLRMHDQKVQDWVAAYAIPDQHTILVSATAGPEMVPNLQRDLPHEISHLVVYDLAGKSAPKVPGWLNEGLALATLPEPDPSLKDVLDEAVRDGVLLSLETLCASDFSRMPPHDAALAYAQSDSMVRYITNRYGMSQIQALISGYADGLSCSGAVERALGIPLATLETQWHGELSRTVTSNPRQEVSLAPWIIAWVVSLILALLFISPQPRSPEEESAYDTRVALSSIPGKAPDANSNKDRP